MEKILEVLLAGFVGESQARNRYTFYASIAKNEGYQQIMGIFQETAEQEKEHAKIYFQLYQQVKNDLGIQGNEAVLSEVAVPTVYGTSADNLQAAVDGEHFENSQLYPEFAQEAENAGYPEIATRIRGIIAAETEHEERYQKLLTLVTDGKVFERTEKVAWICRNCGYVYYGTNPPDKCPVCQHPKDYFQVRSEDF